MDNPDRAWDANVSSFASIHFGVLGVAGFGQVTYGFPNALPDNEIITLEMQFDGSPISLITLDLFERLQIDLMDAAGNVLITYDNNALLNLNLEVLDASSNRFRIHILNTNPATRRIRIISGDLLSLGLLAHDLRIYDITAHTDQEAVYTVQPAKPINDYTNAEVIASAVDPDGEIASAQVTAGSLPTGLALASDGTITVNNTTQLVVGSYTFTVTTTDEFSGTTATELTIVINPADVEAVYVVNPAKPINDYADNEALATVTDANGPIVSAVVSSGALPPGVVLATDGTISVPDTSALVVGSYTFEVTTTDVNGGQTSTSITLEFNPSDGEAVYVIEPAKPVNDYTNGEVIASVTDPNGAIVSATVTDGALPSGVALASDGTVTITNPGDLVPGEYTFEVTTEDEGGGITTTTITLEFNEADVEAVYVVNPAKPINDYADNEALATVNDANGPIVSAVVSNGALPPGVVLATDGNISVPDASALVVGSYTFEVTTTDVNGGQTSTSITLEFNPSDGEAVYVIEPAKPVNDYTNGEVIASVTDPNGAIVSATVTDGTLPPGVALASDGTVTITNPGDLVPGEYTFEVTTEDEGGGITTTTITLEFNEADVEAVYVVNPAKPINDYADSEALATVTDANGPIVSAVVSSGALPPGVVLATDGTISVPDASALVVGSYTFEVTTTDVNGGQTSTSITLEFNPSDGEAVYVIEPAKPVNDYTNGEVIASVTDPNGAIVSATVTDGALPPGVALASDGTVTITNPGDLVPGEYSFEVTTEDEGGGITTTTITLDFNEADVEAIYDIDPPKPVNDYVDAEIIATVTDANGPIVNAAVSGGSLPAGVTLQADGSLVVSNAAGLIVGSYSFQVTTTDVGGGQTTSNISLTFNNADIEAVYDVMAAKPANDYEDDDLLATVTDANGAIVSADLITGSLPPGTVLESDGTIRVISDDQLVGGVYNITVLTKDVINGTTLSNLLIMIHAADIEAVYTLAPAKEIDQYANAEVIATVTDANGAIVNAVVTSGVLPAGTAIEANGTVSVTNSALLTVGSFPVQVTTTDVHGGVSVSNFTIVFKPIADTDNESVYTVFPSKPANDYSENDVLAEVSDPDGDIVSAVVTSGDLPPGVILQSDGTVLVDDPGLLEEGTYSVTVETTDEQGGTSSGSITLVIDEPVITNITVGIAKLASVPQPLSGGQFRVVFTITLENFGNTTLDNIRVLDDLTAAFPAPATYEVSSVATTGMLMSNPNYNGGF
ncbi:putative Ig domain-containing protein [Fulvivirga maritima]|uniref:beta strand repeat-containing protein n=1 Tax=Fulvivirga maritima TaxID=2904247 RepID=UPI001F2DEE6B|nr:putative Ig domain-containing protein [Fulvivirga maritima]UII26254.1 putative Ig domain-containing protein [Fulvivirga maritima]